MMVRAIPCLRLSGTFFGGLGLCARPSRTGLSVSIFLLVPRHVHGAVSVGRVFLFHLAALGGFFVSVHGTNLVHGSVDCAGIVAILGFEFFFKKLRHGLLLENGEFSDDELRRSE